MDKIMKAICLIPNEGIKIQYVPQPQNAESGHLIIKMDACAINPGDKTFINRPLPLGAARGLHNVYGVSGAGTVIKAGEGVPEAYTGKKVAIYRSLKFSEHLIGTWCAYTHVPFLDCVILPDDASTDEYSGSMVNIITPYAFLQQVKDEGHKGIISTAGTSATGIAMVGICSVFNFPLISIVRNEEGKRELEKLGAKNIVVSSDADFKTQLGELAHKLDTTAVFDGIGGELINKILDVIPIYTTIYSYGYLGADVPISFHASILNTRSLTIKSFGNFRSKTVQDPQLLEAALQKISEFIHLPYFKTKTGQKFQLEEIEKALKYTAQNGKKPVLVFD